MPLPEMNAAQTAAPAPWLSIVGIGEDGTAGLSDAARSAVSAAELVFGGARHLALAAPLVRGEARDWPRPFADGLAAVLAARGRPVCVLASGDPFLFGVGASLAKRVDPAEMRVFPSPSSVSLAAARLGWSLPDVAVVSLLTTPVQALRPMLSDRARIIVLVPDGTAPRAIADYLCALGFGASRIAVLEALGGPRERVRHALATNFSLTDIGSLSVVAIDAVADPSAWSRPLAPGIDDALFEHDGQITKREVRALTISALSPRRRQMLWDVGGGSGSVAIEWLLCDPSLNAVTIESRADRAARIHRNALTFGVPHLQVVAGTAPDAFAGLAVPDAVFIGGGASDPGVLDRAMQALRPGGRLVVNAVTVETESIVLARHAAAGGTLSRIALAQAAPVGTMTGWRPAMPITQWTWVKP